MNVDGLTNDEVKSHLQVLCWYRPNCSSSSTFLVQFVRTMNVPVLTNGGSCILQKYRLHTRRPSPPPQTASAPTPQLVVLGSIWGSDPDYMAGSTAQTAVEVHDPSPRHPRQQYASYCKPSVQQDQFAHFNNGRSENKQQLQESVCVKSQQAVSQSQTSPQVELQSTWRFMKVG